MGHRSSVEAGRRKKDLRPTCSPHDSDAASARDHPRVRQEHQNLKKICPRHLGCNEYDSNDCSFDFHARVASHRPCNPIRTTSGLEPSIAFI
ncbi:hypothetical protein ACLOJK_006401 [Asimina triloba]